LLNPSFNLQNKRHATEVLTREQLKNVLGGTAPASTSNGWCGTEGGCGGKCLDADMTCGGNDCMCDYPPAT
jgi:hypothetical protein